METYSILIAAVVIALLLWIVLLTFLQMWATERIVKRYTPNILEKYKVWLGVGIVVSNPKLASTPVVVPTLAAYLEFEESKLSATDLIKGNYVIPGINSKQGKVRKLSHTAMYITARTYSIPTLIGYIKDVQ